MNNIYQKVALTIVFIATINVAAISSAFNKLPDSTKTVLKFKDNRPNRPVFDKIYSSDFELFMLKIAAIKSLNTKNIAAIQAKPSEKNLSDTQKPLDNVKIYPNPVSDKLSLSYSLKKENLVTIKILDVLGNEVTTLMSQKISAGEQVNTFYLASKLTSGLYFVRVIAGPDSIIKRISVL